MKTGEDYNSEVGDVSQRELEVEKIFVNDVAQPGPPTVVIMPTIRQKTGI